MDNEIFDLPNCLITHTTKGSRISYRGNTVDWHYLSMNDDQYRLALEEVKKIYAQGIF